MKTAILIPSTAYPHSVSKYNSNYMGWLESTIMFHSNTTYHLIFLLLRTKNCMTMHLVN